MSVQTVIRSYEARIDDVKPAERAVISKIGGMAIDRHRTRITPSGIDLASYRQNPIVLHEHGRCPTRGTIPVGKNQWIKIDGDRLIARTVFRDDPYSIELFNAYKDEWMRGWSINVISHEASAPTAEEMRAAPGLRDECDIVHRRSELIEYSTTSMPSHRDALTMMVERGIWIPSDVLDANEPESDLPPPSSRATAVVIPRTATDSEGGLAGGGAAVKPTDEGDDGPACDPMCPPDAGCKRCDAARMEAEDAGSRTVPEGVGSASVPGDPDEPIRHDDHGGWVVRGIDGVTFETRDVAERARRQLGAPESFEAIFTAEAVLKRERNRAITADVLEDVRAMLELRYLGKV